LDTSKSRYAINNRDSRNVENTVIIRDSSKSRDTSNSRDFRDVSRSKKIGNSRDVRNSKNARNSRDHSNSRDSRKRNVKSSGSSNFSKDRITAAAKANRKTLAILYVTPAGTPSIAGMLATVKTQATAALQTTIRKP
jgi:hypothetical protein